ncbi:MAG TPA: carbamoyl-phosphate synthase subunit L, partial [Beijerinckiaceae bacterium]|nr:carbamoyl-phosphate synthase subunit L [Beijerinckiaceae bacterium]
ENAFYFMEMNTRLQVEHPVTEAITGLDLVELQFRVASGEKLPFAQKDLKIHGHAVEARLYAEDPESGFLPSTGTLWALRLPEDGVRVDTGVAEGGAVTGFYDPMIAKIITHGETRDAALDRLAAALGETLVAGPRTNVRFLKALCEAPGFRAGDFDTGFIDRNLDGLGAVVQPLDLDAVAAGAALLIEQALDQTWAGPSSDPWNVRDGFALSGSTLPRIEVAAGGERLVAQVEEDGWRSYRIRLAGDAAPRPIALEETEADGLDIVNDDAGFVAVTTDDGVLALRNGRQTEVRRHDPLAVDFDALDVPEGGALIKAPMHGKLIALYVKPGDVVAKGARLAVVEAMKMEHALTAPRDGLVVEVASHVGQQVSEGAKLVVIGEG